MRMTEQYSLKWNQIDLERKQLHLGKTKNGRPRVIPLNSVAISALEELRGDHPSRVVFPSSIRAPEPSLKGSRGWVDGVVEDARVTDYTWHCNRHTFASRLVMSGKDLRTVAELLGHRTL